jgi:predicted AAA+ superfamily ATPase
MTGVKISFKIKLTMAYTRPRAIMQRFSKAIKWSPSLCLIGMRQTGKTTLLKQLAKSYFTFDQDDVLARVHNQEWAFIEESEQPIALDECQKAPQVFDRVKLLIDQRKKPGQFLLTGSVRFLSKRQIRESLTGRTAIFELLPLQLGEAHSKPARMDLLKTFSPHFARRAHAIDHENWVSQSDMLKHLESGGLPGICLKRNASNRNQLLSVHLDTILGRDLKLLYSTRLTLDRLKLLFAEIARMQGLPLNELELARKTGTTAPTIKQLLAQFEALFLVRRHGKTIYCEDGGMALHSLEGATLGLHQSLKTWVFRELLAWIHYHFTGEATLSEFRTRGGAEVPFVIKWNDGRVMGVTLDADQGASSKSILSLAAFHRKVSSSHKQVVCVALCLGSTTRVLRSGVIQMPLAVLA